MRTTYPPDGREQLQPPGAEHDGMAMSIRLLESGAREEFALVKRTLAYLACLRVGQDPDAGSQAAWDQFYGTYAPFILRVARSRRRRSGDPCDGVQEVWRAIVTKLECFVLDPSRGDLRAWILVVARRRLADCDRGEVRWARQGSGGDAMARIASREEDPALVQERQANQDHARSLVEGLRDRISPLSYRVLQMRSIEGKGVAEVATSLGLTADQVRARHHRAVGKLRDLHDGHGDGEETKSKIAPKRPRPTRNKARASGVIRTSRSF